MQWRIQDFPEEGAPTLQGGAPTYDFAKFSQKLHEIERIWAPRGGARPSRPLRSATVMDEAYKKINLTLKFRHNEVNFKVITSHLVKLSLPNIYHLLRDQQIYS